jgi:deazaflavin-dependent oxidoreductase (nitroreductase family)
MVTKSAPSAKSPPPAPPAPSRPDPAEEPAFTDTRRFRTMVRVMNAANPLIRGVLGSRFSGPLGKALMLLRFQGRKSGRWHTTPVSYVREGRVIVVVTSPTYRWWRNVDGGADVEVRVAGRWHRARARLLRPDDPDYDATVALQVRKRGPNMLRGFGVPVDDAGVVPAEARASAPERAHIVRFELEDDA